MSDNTYSSTFRRGSVTDIHGKYIKNDTLLEYIIDFWINCHHLHQKYFWWHRN